MTIASQLQFEKIEGNAPRFFCHLCNGKKPKPIWQIADIKPFVDETSNVSITVCSDECKEMVFAYKHIEVALARMILHIQECSGETLKSQYRDYFRSILFLKN